MRLQLYPTDITYDVIDGKAVILLFGRTDDGRQVCIRDEDFEPHFYVTGDVTKEDLEQVRAEEFFIVKAERVTRNVNEKEQEVWRLMANLPKGVPKLKDALREVKGIRQVFEYDILFTRRYCLDKGILPMGKIEVEGEEIPAPFKVPVFKASSVKRSADEMLISPKILALDIETYNPDNKLDMKKNPILMIGLFGKDFQKVITWKRFDTAEKYIEFVPTESDVLQRFAECVQQFGPDMIVGYYTDGFDFPYIQARAKANKIDLDLGLDHSGVEILGKAQTEAKVTGIAHVDIFKFIHRVVSRSLKLDSYSLDSVAKELLGSSKKKVDMETFFKVWDAGGKDLEAYCQYNLQDCKLTYDLTLKVFPSLIEFVRIIGLFPQEINRMPFSMFVEWYLIRKAAEKNMMILSKPGRTQEMERMSDRIKGAFVYEPTPGFYKNIAVFDFRSLYPSIIASHNISKGTLNCQCCDGPKIETERGTFWYCQKRKGFFSEIIEDLINRRSVIKKEIKTNKDPLLAARSEALKVLANSFYGYMGFAPARWYCIECAESTTAWARHYIQLAIAKAQEAGFKVLYSDTDSVFLLLEEKSKEDAIAWMDKVNESLPGLMELDYEGFYPAGVFVSLKAAEAGAKKKYALLDEKGSMKVKGFESVRRNWSQIAKDVQQKVLEIILKEHDAKKAKSYVRGVVEELRKNKIPLDKMVVNTALSKETQSYNSVGPHVAAAQRMKARGIDAGSGTLIKYIVIKGKGKIRDKVRLPDEAKQDDYDGEYYIQNQIIPGVEKIFAVLGFTVEDLTSETKQSSLSGF